MPTHKRCSRCGQVKDAIHFYTATKSPDGLHWYCVDCCRAYKRTPENRARDRARKQRKIEQAA